MTVEMYRAKYGVKRGGTSWGDWKYYENQSDRLKVDLLEAHLDLMYERAQRPHNWLNLMTASTWSKKLFGERDRKITNVYAVEKLVDGEWNEVTVNFVEPKVTILDGTEVGPYGD